MTRFLASQLATARWFDQRQARQVLQWAPRISLEEGFARLAESDVDPTGRRPRGPAAARRGAPQA
jgi:nucleoside-diphosphate-sugar epimerase